MKFLTGEEGELNEEELINTKFENLQKLKFDDQKWEIDPTMFIVHHGILQLL